MASRGDRSPHLRRRKSLALALGLVIPVASAALLWAASFVPLLALLEARSADWRFRVRGARLPDPEIVLVAVDEATFEATRTKYPFPPSMYADLVDRLTEAGAAVVAFDFLYSEPWRDPAEDALLADAVRRRGNVVWAFHLDRGVRPVLPIPAVREAAVGIGYINLPDERDSRIRRVRPTQGGRDSFSVATVRAYAGFLPPAWTTEELVRINYRGPQGTYPRVSMGDVLRGRFHPEQVKDRICLVGATFEASHDIFPTPFHRASEPDTPGVEIHANAVGNMLRGDTFRDVPARPQWLALILLAMVPSLLFALERPWWALAGWVLACSGWGAWAFHAFMENRVALLVAPILLLTLAFWGGAFGQYLLERQRRREIRDLFASYVDPSVVEWVLRHPDGVNLEGQRIVATIMDTDIEGFTSITERLDPAVLIAQLNEYFESITAAAIEAGGLHDKYVGDALMVIYGFPVGREDHALRAVMAAREILSRVERLNQDWERRGLPPLNTRIGICSGEVVIGNVGSSKRKTFTAMGDAANMASRLEGLNKRFGTRVILSESTALLLPPDIPLRDLGEVEVRGISKPIRLFNPTFDVRPGSQQGPPPPRA